MAMDEGYGAVKMTMKRKELDDVNDNFSDFSLSSPARKIRRLNAELPPIMEEEEPDIPLVFSQSKENSAGISSVVIEELGVPDDSNEERAIVLFNPINNNNSPPLVHSPSSYSFSVSPDFISGFKNQVLWSSQSNLLKAADDRTDKPEDEKSGRNNGCLAVVPWVPMHSQSSPTVEDPQMDVCEMMEADEPEVATMEIEDNGHSFERRPGHEFGGMSVSEGLNQWQQHCMLPQPPQNLNLSTPVTWFR